MSYAVGSINLARDKGRINFLSIGQVKLLKFNYFISVRPAYRRTIGL